MLIFSHSVKMLNILQLWLQCKGLRHSRIDGAVKGSAERQQIVDTFNADPSIFCCLLTSQVGGVGLTLTGADRVLVVDPDWNPSTDNQASPTLPHHPYTWASSSPRPTLWQGPVPTPTQSPPSGHRPCLPHWPEPGRCGLQAHHLWHC